MPAIKLKCSVCGCRFWAARRDTLYCKSKCRTKARAELARFTVPHLPKSGVPGVNYQRIQQRWEVKVKEEDGRWKYVGTLGTLKEALGFRKQVLGNE